MEKRRAQAIYITAKIFRLVFQTLRRDIIGRAPNFTARLRFFRGNASQAEIANLRRVCAGVESVRRFDVAMHQAFGIRRAQTFRGLYSSLEDKFLREFLLLLDLV